MLQSAGCTTHPEMWIFLELYLKDADFYPCFCMGVLLTKLRSYRELNRYASTQCASIIRERFSGAFIAFVRLPKMGRYSPFFEFMAY